MRKWVIDLTKQSYAQWEKSLCKLHITNSPYESQLHSEYLRLR